MANDHLLTEQVVSSKADMSGKLQAVISARDYVDLLKHSVCDSQSARSNHAFDSPVQGVGCTAWVRVGDTRCGTYVIYAAICVANDHLR